MTVNQICEPGSILGRSFDELWVDPFIKLFVVRKVLGASYELSDQDGLIFQAAYVRCYGERPVQDRPVREK